jgi:WS/DGAT/MGAT family acyltransferase
MPFSPPPDAKPDHLRHLMDEIRESCAVFAPWNQKLKHPDLLMHPMQAWVTEEKVDIEYHVRRSALPSPGDERELGIVVSRLHSHALDLHRPPWEVHLIEGLEGGRFAIYAKVHHALVDGYSAIKVLSNSLTTDPGDRERPLFFSVAPSPRKSEASGTLFPDLLGLVREQLGSTRTVAKALMNLARGEKPLVTPLHAPKSILNAKISRSRRFATQKVETARLKAIAKAVDGTLNDVVMALSAASLRRYLLEQHALPDAPLIAMVPVNIRPRGDAGGGNAVGAILASLATDVPDAADRIASIIRSTKNAKEQLQGMSQAAIIQYSALLLAPFMLQLIPGAMGRVRPTFNVVISNVPGPEEALYFRGARLEGSFPMSIPVHGLALNITVSSYAGWLNFGFIGCRDSLPHLQRMAVYCGEALDELERAVRA